MANCWVLCLCLLGPLAEFSCFSLGLIRKTLFHMFPGQSEAGGTAGIIREGGRHSSCQSRHSPHCRYARATTDVMISLASLLLSPDTISESFSTCRAGSHPRWAWHMKARDTGSSPCAELSGTWGESLGLWGHLRKQGRPGTLHFNQDSCLPKTISLWGLNALGMLSFCKIRATASSDFISALIFPS